ncbi:MAG TPA: integrase arm-type DNA-binding domain-containing protein [Stellaceae bacterium]|jgi:integrase|nr:integrase arm-type DNA-binding domain-containing protein [Stellaceae bacterium]
MARAGKLTALKVGQIVRAAKPGYTGDGGGLYLQISKFGTPSWAFRYRVGSRLREAGLGSYDTWTLAEARERARVFRQQRALGEDPIEKRRAQRMAAKIEAATAMSFRACAEAYVAAHKAGWRSAKHGQQWQASLRDYVYPVFGDLPVQVIDTALVTKAIEPIWAVKTETASRVRGRIESVLDWATAREYRTGENPARWRGHLENLLPKKNKVRRVEHHAALPYSDIGAFMGDLRQQEGTAERALEFAILTAARTGEVIGAKWGEINQTERVWTVPADRMKGGREHRVPLSDAAMAIVEKMAATRSSDYVFPGHRRGKSISSTAFFMLLREMGRDDLTAHGFRSTFRDWAAERTNFPSEVAEMALAHAVSDKVAAAYRRGDLFQKRRQLADAWAKFCATTAAESAKVVSIRSAAK